MNREPKHHFLRRCLAEGHPPRRRIPHPIPLELAPSLAFNRRDCYDLINEAIQKSYHKKLKVSADSFDRGRVFTVSSFCLKFARTPTTTTAKPLDLQLTSEKVASSSCRGCIDQCTSCGESALVIEPCPASCLRMVELLRPRMPFTFSA